ncbi:hypothetical protein L226DRAFT_584919 [Lentinus tigrinus ALCF2SS1-7]|uniref:uncharacterized protein n=1 Tax=Lentinus tigrinus ALCF2SS1-7 TaxID=1328758 RepID=UPI0011661C3E|nr:hypothetical protein L226DRAFT_584919 [Lentinus tigrinus ALCF2SS1-7]
MSSTADDSAFAAEYASLLLSDYSVIAATVVFLYECLITFGDEVNLFWSRPFTGATVLFVSNRAIIVWTHIFAMFASYIPLSLQLCEYSKSKSGVWDPPICTMGSVTIGINFSVDSGLCEVTIASRTCLISTDALLVLVTWWKLSRGSLVHRRKGSFVYVLLRDGTIYFIALLALNALHLTLTLLSHVQALQSVSVVTLFTEPLTGILVGRFLLNLQSANRKALDIDSSIKSGSGSGSESLVFERVIGSLGCRTFSDEEEGGDEDTCGGEVSDTGASTPPGDA